MRVLPCGDTAVLLELDGPTAGVLAQVRALTAAIRRTPPTGLIDVVPAERTVLVRVAAGTDLDALRRTVLALHPLTDRADRSEQTEPPDQPKHPDRAESPVETVHICVVYDGPDLAYMSAQTGLGPAEVVAAHTGTPWTVAFCGFAPGFGYLVGGDPRLAVPRRDSPRARVPRGSVALAGSYSAVYPGDSPGGWALLGRTDLAVWDLERDPPALLRPGVRVIFHRVDE